MPVAGQFMICKHSGNNLHESPRGSRKKPKLVSPFRFPYFNLHV